MKHIKITIILMVFAFNSLMAQTINSDNKFQRPLTDVLADIEKQFDVKLRISGKSVDSLVLNYANWRIRPWDINETLNNVLAPFDLVALPDGEKKYKIEGFRYHLRSIDEAKEMFNYLSNLYEDKIAWEERRAQLITELREAISLDVAPKAPNSKPILTKEKKINSYTIQNFALECMPGVYICGTIYRPAKIKGKIPVVLCPIGHFNGGRYNKDLQARCAGLATMGAMAVQYDLFAWGESQLQFKGHHHESLANTVHAVNTERILDYMLSFNYTDEDRVGITGGSGGGSHTMLMAAIDNRIKVSVPAVMMSAIHYGGCPCESGNPIHLCGGGTNNVEIASIFAPKPQLIISDGKDWTKNVPELEFPFLRRTYSFYEAEDKVENAHFPKEGHDYGASKRAAMYRFMAKHLKLDESKVFDKGGELNESFFEQQSEDDLKALGKNGEKLPANAISFEELKKMFR